MNLARIAWMTAGLAGISLPAFFDRLRIPQRRARLSFVPALVRGRS